MNTYSFNNKGFTLIELLVVVAIIGLLASIIMVSLNTARVKSKDAFLRNQAVQMRTLLEYQYSEVNSYLGLNPNSMWMNSSADCDSIGFSGNYVTQARTICKAIVANSSVTWTNLKFYLGTSTTDPNKYSIMVALPYKNTFLCFGSSGVNSDTDNNATWVASGCWANP